MERTPINPKLSNTFVYVYQLICSLTGKRTPNLVTTGGVLFNAEAKVTKDGRRFISLPHNNRIYENDWGFMSNSMGKVGQRIGQYSVPLDTWAALRSNFTTDLEFVSTGNIRQAVTKLAGVWSDRIHRPQLHCLGPETNILYIGADGPGYRRTVEVSLTDKEVVDFANGVENPEALQKISQVVDSLLHEVNGKWSEVKRRLNRCSAQPDVDSKED